MLPLLNGEFGVAKDPELSFTKQGNARGKIRIGAKERVRDSTGTYTDGPSWYADLIVWGKIAQHLVDSVEKGDTIVVVNAKAESYKWTDKEGNEREGTQFVVSDHPASMSSVGVSVRWRPTKAAPKQAAVEAVEDVFGKADEIPF